MPDMPCQFVVLAAGEGTRMRSAKPKVMHEIAGEPMLGHVLDAVSALEGADATAVVVGPDMEAAEAFVGDRLPKASLHVQTERLGTAHAVLAAGEALREDRDLVVLYGDTPLVRPQTIERLRDSLGAGAAVAALGFEAADPAGYGRLIAEDGHLLAIREHKDASDEEKEIKLCNSGIMAVSGTVARSVLDAIGNENIKGEYYLTDAVEVAVKRGLGATFIRCDEEEVLGVNTRAQLAVAEARMQERLREAAMAAGATLVSPETVFLSHDTVLGRDVVVEPHVVFGPGVRVADDVRIRAFSHLERASVGEGAVIGPYARLRPGADIGEKARIGNFVEVKAATIAPGAKANHLAYIGDATIGAGANIGAGTITCNYDGFNKHHTEIGAGAFIGSNSALVAPVTIGEGAYIGSGSVITRTVSPDALAVGRARQVEIAGWAKRKRGSK